MAPVAYRLPHYPCAPVPQSYTPSEPAVSPIGKATTFPAVDLLVPESYKKCKVFFSMTRCGWDSQRQL